MCNLSNTSNLGSFSKEKAARSPSAFRAGGVRPRPLVAIFLLFLWAGVTSLQADTTNSTTRAAANVDLTQVPLEQLLNMKVTILRGHDTLSKTPAAISIVTSDDIRRSGAMSIPE